MSTNLETVDDSHGKMAMLYRFKKERVSPRRVIDENWHKNFISPPVPNLSVLKIYDQEGREILSIERGDG